MRKSYKFLLFISILLCLTTFFSTAKVKKDLNLLIITLDTTRSDSIGIYGNSNVQTPAIDSLGKKGAVFLNCYAPVPLTLPSHCSIFTGRYPVGHLVRNNGTYVLSENELTLAEILREEDYQTSAIISSFTLFSKFGLAQGFNRYDEAFHSQNMILNFSSEIPADRVYDKFKKWLRDYQDGAFFLWLHFYDPHTPYLPHTEINSQADQTNRMRYYGEISFVDIFIQKILQDIQAKGLLDNTLIVITGDHGEAFGEHGEHGHGIFCYEESLKVPLIFYNEHLIREPRVIDKRVSLVDIMPTILEIFDRSFPSSTHGRSLLRLIQGRTDRQKRPIYFESMDGNEKNNWAPLTGIIDQGYKFISLPDPELYQLDNDHKEKNNLFQDNPKKARELDSVLKSFLLKHTSQAQSSRITPDQNDIQMLRSLGYISSFSSSNKMIDPKQGIALYAELAGIGEHITQGRYSSAEKKLAELKNQNPDVSLPLYYQALFEIYINTDREKQALSVLEEGIESFPQSEELIIQLAISVFRNKNYEKTESLCRRLLENNPSFTGAYILLGDIHEAKGLYKDAAWNYEKAYEIEPQNHMVKAKYILLLLKNDQYKKAKENLNELLEHRDMVWSSSQTEIMIDIGIELAEKNQSSEAVSLMKSITKHNPNNSKAWLNLGTLYQQTGRQDNSIQYFQKAIDIDPDYGLAYSHIGMAYLSDYLKTKEKDLIQKADRYFKEALQKDPDIPDAHNGLGVIYLSQNRKENAIAEFKKAILLKPDYFEAYFNLSLIFSQTGRQKEALDLLERFKARYYNRMSEYHRNALDRIISDLKR